MCDLQEDVSIRARKALSVGLRARIFLRDL